MKSIFRCLVAALVIALLAVTTLNAVTLADSTTSNNLDQTTSFLSNVVGLDMTKYSLITPFYQPRNITVPPNVTLSNPANVAGLNVDAGGYNFNSDTGTLDTMSIFYNGQLSSVNLYLINSSSGSYIYAIAPPTDVINQANDLLTRYAAFITQNSAIDTSFLTSMKDVLSSGNIQSSANFTTGNINFQSSQTGNRTRLQWIYTEDSIVMNWKRVEMDFNNNDLTSFYDSWSLYKVSGLSVISAQEATTIARNAAQNVTISIGNANGTVETLKVPDLSNASYDVQFNMLPYRGDDPNFPSKIARDPLTLYPYWQFHFYFNQSVAGDDGVQVGVWGDTSEIIYASGYGYLGYNPPTTSLPESFPNPTTEILPQSSPNATSAVPEFPILAIVPLLIGILSIGVIIKNRSRKID